MKRDGSFGLKMAETCNSGYLVHIDLSDTSMDANECKIFGETIKENHTLWGLHMMGNDCYVNSMGFVRNDIKSKTQSRDVLHKNLTDGVGFLSNIKKNRDAKINSYQNCWVCEGWREQKFVWDPAKSGNILKEPVYIHFDFDDYRPSAMSKA